MRKLVQLKLYSFLSTKWGLSVFVIGLFLMVISALQLLRVVIERVGERKRIRMMKQRRTLHHSLPTAAFFL
jgi:hypothetical protein